MTLKAPRRSRAAQAGFTLVEIAIVLVIIGLLLGGVLKGQELIENGRVKAAANDFNGISAAYNSYIDRYKRIPGDDGPAATFTARGGSWTSVATGAIGDNSGVIDAAAAETFAGGGEVDNFFAQLRAGQFINGDPAATGLDALPLNPWGGRVGIVNVTGIQGRTQVRLMLCMSNVPGKAALALDNQFDDGAGTTGNFRGNPGPNVTAPGGTGAAYSEAETYTVCRDM